MKFPRIGLVMMLGLAAAQPSHAYKFGDDWTVGSQCKVLKQVGSKTSLVKLLWFRHTGNDLIYPAGSEVKVNSTLYYDRTVRDSTGWMDHVVACTALDAKGKCKTDAATAHYDFLHLVAATGLKQGQSLKGVVIGKLADLSAKGTASHLHLSKRNGPFDLDLVLKGSLPPAECNDAASRLQRPSYPENFVDPDITVVTITKKK